MNSPPSFPKSLPEIDNVFTFELVTIKAAIPTEPSGPKELFVDEFSIAPISKFSKYVLSNKSSNI